jgi:hypothetical protein
MKQNQSADIFEGAGRFELGLPLLESMGWADTPKGAYKPPVRLGFMYMPHGVIMDQFWPKSPGGISDFAAAGAGVVAAGAERVCGDEGDFGGADCAV